MIRGEEHLSNTPRQVLIYQALGFPLPAFAHISLILGKDRSKMSKRHGSTSVVQYREKGYLPEALVNFLALLGWSPEGEEEIFSMEELIEQFSLERVAKNPAVFDLDKLNWINGYYIRQKPPESITDLAIPYLQAAGYLPATMTQERYRHAVKMVAAVQEYLSCVSEIVDHVQLFFAQDISFETEEARAVIQEEQVPQVVRVFAGKLINAPDLETDTVKKILKETNKELNRRAQGVYAFTGSPDRRMHGQSFMTLFRLGKEKVLRR